MTKILIIDDNVNLTTLLSKALAKFGFDPYVENHSLLALGTVRQLVPDLILLDVMMPERDGGRVLADLRADLSVRYIPVILLTALAREAQGLGDMDGIRSTVIGKPVDLKQLIGEIETQLDQARSYNQRLATPHRSASAQPHAALPEHRQANAPAQRTASPSIPRAEGPPPTPRGSVGQFSFFGNQTNQVPQPISEPTAQEDSQEPISATGRWEQPS